MKLLFSMVLICSAILLCKQLPNEEKYLFFLHNRFLETNELNDLHPTYGRTEYAEIIAEFEKSDFRVFSEKRNGNVNVRTYAMRVVRQLDSLLANGVAPNDITVVGTSKGGYIAQYVSTFAHNPALNFVFIGSFRLSDMQTLPDINYCGNILTIYDTADPFGVSALQRKKASSCRIEHFKEIEITTGKGHGFLFKPLKAWMQPTIQWANGMYNLEQN